MRIPGRLARFAIATTGLAFFIGAPTAGAAQYDQYACQFSMRATLDYGRLSFVSDGANLPTVCTSTAVGTDSVHGNASSATDRVTGGGSTNLGFGLCETGMAQGSIDVSPSAILASTGSPPPQHLTAGLVMTFLGGHGTLNLTGVYNGRTGNGLGVGYVAMVPDDPNKSCMHSLDLPQYFTLEGAFTVLIPLPVS